MGPAECVGTGGGGDIGTAHEFEPGGAPIGSLTGMIGLEGDDEGAQASRRIVVLAVGPSGEPADIEVARTGEVGYP